MSHIDDSINQHQNQQDQPDSSSEISMFTLITPEGQSSSSSQVVIKNDTNNNNNDRNNNNGKTKLEKLSNLTNDDDGNNNQQKRHGLQLNGLQRYHVENCTNESSLHPSSSVHPHHLLLLQQQQQMGQNQMLLDKQSSSNLIPVSSDNSPSLIVLQPSGQPGTPYSPFPYHYAAGKYRIIAL
jgi:hypothetical protein